MWQHCIVKLWSDWVGVLTGWTLRKCRVTGRSCSIGNVQNLERQQRWAPTCDNACSYGYLERSSRAHIVVSSIWKALFDLEVSLGAYFCEKCTFKGYCCAAKRQKWRTTWNEFESVASARCSVSDQRTSRVWPLCKCLRISVGKQCGNSHIWNSTCRYRIALSLKANIYYFHCSCWSRFCWCSVVESTSQKECV